jgi:hypothetical protein
MWKGVVNGFRFLEGILLILGAVGFLTFWARTRFWLPKYIHVLAAIGLIVGGSSQDQSGRRHRHVPTDQKVLSRSFLNACPMVRCILRQPQRRWVGKLPAGAVTVADQRYNPEGEIKIIRRTANGAKSY